MYLEETDKKDFLHESDFLILKVETLFDIMRFLEEL